MPRILLSLVLALSVVGCARFHTRGREDAPEPPPVEGPGEPPAEPGPVDEPPLPVDPPVEACDARGATFDFDGDGVPLACDDLVELPAVLVDPSPAAELGALQTSFTAAGDTIAVLVQCPEFGARPPGFDSGCESRPPLVIDGDERAALYEEVLGDDAAELSLRAVVSGDRQTWLWTTSRAAAEFGWKRVYEGELTTPTDEPMALRDVHAAPSGEVLAQHFFDDSTQALDLWEGDVVTPLEIDAARVTVEAVDDALHIVAHQADASASLSTLRAGSLRRDVLIGRGGEEAIRRHESYGAGGAWYCAADVGGVNARLARVIDGRLASGHDFPVPGAFGCRDLLINARIEDALWITSRQVGGGMLFRRPEAPGAALELLVDDYQWTPMAWQVPGGHVIRQNFPGGIQEVDVFTHSLDGATRTLIADAEPGTAVAVRGEAIGTVARWPMPPGSAATPIEIHVRVVRDGVVRHEVLPTTDPRWPHVYGSFLSPESVMWLRVRDLASGPQHIFTVDADEGASRRMEVEELWMSWNGAHGLLSMTGPEAGLYRLDGMELTRLASAAGVHHQLLGRVLPEGIDEAGLQWISWERAPGDHVVASWSEAGLDIVLEGLEDAPLLEADAHGRYWLLYPRAGMWDAALLAGGELRPIHVGYDHIAPVLAQRDPTQRTRAFGLRLMREGETRDIRVCPFHADDGVCRVLPLVDATDVVAPRVTSEGRLFAIVEEGGRRYVWRPR